MDFFDSRYFRLNKLLLSFLGLWPYQTPNMKCLTLSFSVLGATTTLLPQVIYFLKHWNDLDEVFEVMPMTCVAFLNLMKIICLTYNSKKFAVLLRLTQEDWNNLLKNRETQIITRYIGISRKFTLAYLYCTLVFTSCYALTPAATYMLDLKSPLNETKSRKLFYPAEYLVNQEKYYYVLLLSEYVGYYLCVLIGVTTDITYFLLLEHTCGMHAVLCHRLEILNGLYKLEWIDSNQSNGSDGIGHCVRRCIQLDKRIRIYMKMMESAFATNLLIDIAVGALFYICTCIMIVIRARRLFEIMRLVAVAILYTSRFFLISWTGQKVTDHSSEIPIAVYDCMWYRMPIKIQKMLMLLIVRGQRPSRIILAGIYIINLESFTSVMRASVSYCTVMISLRSTMENT